MRGKLLVGAGNYEIIMYVSDIIQYRICLFCFKNLHIIGGITRYHIAYTLHVPPNLVSNNGNINN